MGPLGNGRCRVRLTPDEFYVHKPTLAANRPAYRAPHHGGRKKSAWFTRRPRGTAKQVKIEDVPQEQRDIFSLTNEEVQELAKTGHYKW